MFMDVRGCLLRVVGVPVKLRRITRREESNYEPRACRCLLMLVLLHVEALGYVLYLVREKLHQ